MISFPDYRHACLIVHHNIITVYCNSYHMNHLSLGTMEVTDPAMVLPCIRRFIKHKSEEKQETYPMVVDINKSQENTHL